MDDLLRAWAEWSTVVGPLVLLALQLATATLGTVHVLLHKQSTRAATGWIAFLWLVPVIGTTLYLVLGINRIQRRARELRGPRSGYRQLPVTARESNTTQAEDLAHPLAPLARTIDAVSARPLLDGNAIDLLENGDTAYPAMLEAIEGAACSVALCTYIFDDDPWGRRFVEALAAAVARDVAVRVLVDGVGALYSMPTIVGRLRRAGVPVAKFLWSWMPWGMPYLNLRSHRKLLLVDGRLAFTGGMNLRAGHVLGDRPPHPVRDLAARVRGPVVAELMQVFALDWRFTTGETLEGEAWFPTIEPAGSIRARALPDGPDEDLGVAESVFLGALACARERVCILTPYFVPEDHFLTALEVCARRGVEVDLLLPARSNLAYVQWASMAELERLLGAVGADDLGEAPLRVWLTDGPFDHTKLMVVDGAWVLLGSVNWDARSLRLNFELQLEAWDRALAARCEALVQERLGAARQVDREGLLARGPLRRLRDRAARLLKPYI